MKLIKKLLAHELISGASIIFLSSQLASFLNFLFNLFMSRNLSPSDYGALVSLISLLTLSTLPASAVIPTIVNFGASYFAKKDFSMTRGLFLKVTKPFLVFGVFAFAIFFIFAKTINQFLNIQNESLLILTGLSVLLSFVGIANIPLLQAKLEFTFISFLNIVGALLKLSLGILFVFVGFAVGGAMWALFLSSFISYILTFIPLRFLFNTKMNSSHIGVDKLFVYGGPAALASFGLASFITTDILLVKHFFSPELAGAYAVLSLLGRIIFFFSAPIVTVMFPLITQKHTRNESFHGIFRLSLFLVLLSSAIITIFYFMFPEFVIKLSTKETYLGIAPYLGTFGIFISFYSLLSITSNFYLSVKKTIIFLPIIIGAIIQGILIWFYHQNFLQIILISLSVVGLLLFLLLVYYWNLYGRKQKK